MNGITSGLLLISLSHLPAVAQNPAPLGLPKQIKVSSVQTLTFAHWNWTFSADGTMTYVFFHRDGSRWVLRARRTTTEFQNLYREITKTGFFTLKENYSDQRVDPFGLAISLHTREGAFSVFVTDLKYPPAFQRTLDLVLKTSHPSWPKLNFISPFSGPNPGFKRVR